ncbi:MAG TPA: hypothetical protein VJC39_03330 [Candidatus Nanoarchaeia archaeon]|nr:hypothetical protein [Candidatus Nanoarchaeia archaeon]
MKKATISGINRIPPQIRGEVFWELTGMQKSIYDYRGGAMNPFENFEKQISFVYKRMAEDLAACVTANIAPSYRELNRYATLLNSDQVNLLCAEATMSLGKSATKLALEKKLDTMVKVDSKSGDLKIDAEVFLRKLQTKLFEYYVHKFGYS